MGRKTKQREDQNRQRAESAAFALHHRTAQLQQKPPFVTEFAHFHEQWRQRVCSMHEHYVHQPHTWTPRIKSKAEARRFIDCVEYVFFERYPVPKHLKMVWVQAERAVPLTRQALLCANFRHWYVIAAQGGSLYKEVARPYLSKQELHHFLNPPAFFTDPTEAYWYAIARAQSEDERAAIHVALSRIRLNNILPAGESPWPDIARYFARNPTTMHEISDLSDYIAHEIAEGNREPLEHPLGANRRAYSLKGRTLATLRRRQEEWHRALRKQRSIGGGSWKGMEIADSEYRAGNKDKRAIWRFTQIKTGDALYKEGQRMHHCVAGYKSQCMNGQTFIWKLTYEFPLGVLHRGLTIQVSPNNTIIQVRGYANRQPAANERDMVLTWARENGLTWNGR